MSQKNVTIKVKENDFPEFLGQIIDVFEDFLEEKGINISNDEKDETDNPAILYGSDYALLESEIMDILVNWDIHHSEKNIRGEEAL